MIGHEVDRSEMHQRYSPAGQHEGNLSVGAGDPAAVSATMPGDPSPPRPTGAWPPVDVPAPEPNPPIAVREPAPAAEVEADQPTPRPVLGAWPPVAATVALPTENLFASEPSLEAPAPGWFETPDPEPEGPNEQGRTSEYPVIPEPAAWRRASGPQYTTTARARALALIAGLLVITTGAYIWLQSLSAGHRQPASPTRSARRSPPHEPTDGRR
jgi:hypothetical protein